MSVCSAKCRLALILLISVLAGCAVYAQYQLDEAFGTAQVRSRYIDVAGAAPEFHRDIKPILDRRCVVCHGCYDAPCQLKMEAFEGLDRGASKARVYDGKRLLAVDPSRLFIDAFATRSWRDKGFYPVLNERAQSPQANLQGSVLYRMLALKQRHPSVGTTILPESFDLRLHRDQQCPKIEEFDSFEKKFPLWGMPYALPALQEQEFQTIKRWIELGAKATRQLPLGEHYQQLVTQWEAFLNGGSPQQQLMSRYIYEHLFTAHLYFKSQTLEQEHTQFFKLHRSVTPPGEPVAVIATRRPYDDPGVDRVFYRLVRVDATLTAKSHMPYALDEKRMQRWQELFLDQDFSIKSLPGYQAEVAANPFIVFKDLPVASRYRFMLDEAQFTIMSFIKGPVCRGQVAINVINDHFWVLFANPENTENYAMAEFLAQQKEHLRLPSELQSNVIPMESWLHYSRTHQKYLQAKHKHLNKLFPSNKDITLDVLWSGDGHNSNAALTVFRHFDSASVMRGLLGRVPKTAWVIDYPLLERIHYLLVSGFDVYGNIGHQLETRLYMDFLRMEGEYNFLALLPDVEREREIALWYRGAESKVRDYVEAMRKRGAAPLGIQYVTVNPKKELFERLRQRMGPDVVITDQLNTSPEPEQRAGLLNRLRALSAINGVALSHMPEVSLLRIGPGSQSDKLYSILVNRAHSNVSQLFRESDRLIPEEQTMTLVEGIVSAYPNSFLQLTERQLPDFIQQVSRLRSEANYRQLLDNYGVRRTSDDFWVFSDWLHHYYQQAKPIEASWLDYNRFDNR